LLAGRDHGAVLSSADRSAEKLAAVVDQLRATNAGLREVIDAQAAQFEAQAGRIAELERRLGADSTTSNRPGSGLTTSGRTR